MGLNPLLINEIQNNIDTAIFEKSRCFLTIRISEVVYGGYKFFFTVDLLKTTFDFRYPFTLNCSTQSLLNLKIKKT